MTITTIFLILSILFLLVSVYYTITTIAKSKAIVKHLQQLEEDMENQIKS